MICDKFLWGASTAAPQIEGGWDVDGRSPSVWDLAPSNKIKNGDNCHESTEHYHRYKEDIKLMKELGLNSYRFSLSWSRIIPSEGVINPKGIEFYNNLINELLANDIKPLVTLYHWDLPAWVAKKGGWEKKEIINLFSEYAKVVIEAFSDRVKYWTIFNEPQNFIFNSYAIGKQPPFRFRISNMVRAAKVSLLVHAKAVDTMREYAKQKIYIGFSSATSVAVPQSDNEEEINRCRNLTFNKSVGKICNNWWSDPLYLAKGVRAYGMFHISNKFAKSVYRPLDFYGINTYGPMMDKKYNAEGKERNSLNWIIDERTIYWACKYFYERYKMPILISENGICDDDKLESSICDDKLRQKYLPKHIEQVLKAKKEGVPIFGYQYWSLLDNFEWLEGYTPRFGLIYVDYKTKERTLKQSAYLYKQIIKDNGGNL